MICRPVDDSFCGAPAAGSRDVLGRSFEPAQGRPTIQIGVPKEFHPAERRVAATPESVGRLRESGLEVLIERGAGLGSDIDDAAYQRAGAILVDRSEALGADLVVAVRPPTAEDVAASRPGGIRISHLYPERHPELPAALAARRISAIALERIPRITRAQKMDVLSSMANLAGYRAIVEAAACYEGVFGPQVTAAGSTPPARVLVIGAGVAGLAAIGAARALGAEVRAFDTRAAAREQVESLGGTFLEVPVDEKGEGAGGYGRTMSAEFIAAEMALFRAQAAEVSVIVTTALVPGTKAPTLVPRDVVEALAPGSVVVDLAAEQGGNCELTRPGEVYRHPLPAGGHVSIVGYVDLASRMAATASRFFAGNLVHLLVEMGAGRGEVRVDPENEVVRPALLTHGGAVLPPAPAPVAAQPGAAVRGSPAAPGPSRPPAPDAKPQQEHIQSPVRAAWGSRFRGLLVIGLLFALGRFAPGDFLQHFTIFILACFVGWQVVWAVTPALHTPLMSVTNAISGIIIVGGMLGIGPRLDPLTWLGAAAVLVASINVVGGFMVTQRMLRMFRKE